MPCYDSRSSPENVAKEYAERLQLLTRVACELANGIKAGLPLDALSREAQSWVAEHDRLDAEREKRRS